MYATAYLVGFQPFQELLEHGHGLNQQEIPTGIPDKLFPVVQVDNLAERFDLESPLTLL